MISGIELLAQSAGWSDLHGLMQARGWPLTKAGYLRAWLLHNKLAPVFPLDAETLAKVPHQLPGPLPQSAREMYALTGGRSSPPAEPPSPPPAA